MSDTPRARPRLSDRWFAQPWVIILMAAVVGVPSVFLGLTLIALFFVNPVTWFLAGAVWFGVGFRHYRHRLTIRDTPMSKVDAAAIGLVEVSGRVRSQTPEVAPISGTPCVHWHIKVETHKDDKPAVISDQQSPTRCFDIEDATGKVMIWPWASELIVTDVQRWEGAAAAELADTVPAGPIRERLKLHAARAGGLVVTEEKIEIGRTLYVIGVLSERRQVVKPTPFWERVRRKLQPNLGGGSATGVDAAKIFVLAIAMVVLMLASGRFLALNEVSTEADQPPAMDPQQVLIWRGERDRPFIIADTPEGVVINTLTRWTKVNLAGGAATMVGTVILYLGGLF